MKQWCKRWLAAALGLILVISSSTAVFAQEPTERQTAQQAVGERLQGFVLEEKTQMASFDAEVYHWRHETTGASVWFVQNDDKQRCFSMTFRTEPSDDTGKLHILEHAICASSEKYPGRDVFFDAYHQTYLTEINAMTAGSATSYYVSSMSETQLEVLADFYLDCAFHSSLRKDRRYFEREGWRYALEDAEAPLTVEGIVYNEMQAEYNDTSTVVYDAVRKALFPDTYQRFDSGGIPVEMPNLTYEELIAFYDECYQPSNCTVMLYGDLEMERFLQLLGDGYFSEFPQAKEGNISSGQEAFVEPIRAEVSVNAESTQETGALVYAVALEEAVPPETIQLLNLLLFYLGQESFPFLEMLQASGIGALYDIEQTYFGTQCVLLFSAEGADITKADAFVEVLREALREITENGIDATLMESLLQQQLLQGAISEEAAAVGVSLAMRMLECIHIGREENFAKTMPYAAYTTAMQDGTYEALLQKYVLDNPHAVLLTVKPQVGLAAQQAAEQEQWLAEKKAAMTEEEITALVADTEAFAEWTQLPTPQETLNQLKAETADTIQTTVVATPTEMQEREGVTVYTAEAEGPLVYCEYQLDLSHLDTQEVQEMQLYTYLYGASTTTKEEQEVFLESTGLLQDISVGVQILQREDGTAYPALQLGFYTGRGLVAEAAQLAMELLRDIDIATEEEALELAMVLPMQNFYTPEMVAQIFRGTIGEPTQKQSLLWELEGIGFCQFLAQIQQDWAVDAEAVKNRLEQTREKAFVRENAVVLYVGEKSDSETAIEQLLAQLPASQAAATAGDWTELAQVPQRVAIVADTPTSYLLQGANLQDMQESITGEWLVAAAVLESEILLPELRFRDGAYGVSMSVNEQGNCRIVVEKAPAFQQTLLRTQELADMLRALAQTITEEELEGYRLSVLSRLLTPMGKWQEAKNTLYRNQMGLSAEDRNRLREEVVATTPESLTAVADRLEHLTEQMRTVVISDAAQIRESVALFDTIYFLS